MSVLLHLLTVLPGGWDGRDRMHTIDTKTCPVYMMTGEYDWSNTPEMSQKTADKIPGGKCVAMKGLGHFPAVRLLAPMSSRRRLLTVCSSLCED